MMLYSPNLVIVDQFDVARVRALKSENDAPISPHRHRPESLQAAFQRVQAIPRKVHSLRRLCPIEPCKNVLHVLDQVVPYAAAITLLVEPFESSMFEAPDR